MIAFDLIKINVIIAFDYLKNLKIMQGTTTLRLFL